MSKLNDLITQLCPDGVPYKKLGDLCTIETGRLNANKAVDDGAYPFFTTAEKTSRINSYRWDTEALLIAGNANVGSVKHYTGKFEAYQRTYVLTNFNQDINVRFLFHFTRAFLKKYLANKSNSAAMTYIVLSTLKNFEIPLPPLPVQEEVVRILDSFTELEAELEAELADRKEQYEYYRDYLLDKKNLEHMDGKPVETKRLDEIFNLKNGYTPSKNNAEYWKNGDVNWFRMDDIRTNGRILSDSIQKVSMDGIKGGKLFEADSLIVSTSATIGEHAIITVPFMCNQRFACLTRKTDYKPLLDMKFMFYYASKLDKYCLKNINQGGFASVSMPAFKEFPIPLPSLATQERIVDILDRFDTLTTSLTDGIPAEIAMRREQYEYCRSRLLDFPCLSDSSASDGE